MVGRPSVYLLKKAECLLEAINFFLGSGRGTWASAAEKRLVFLSQIEFWEWEVDNLVFSFESFAERSVAWENVDEIRKQLARLGISARSKVLHGLEVDRRWSKWYRQQQDPVVAPMEALGSVVSRWNELLDLCEKKLLYPTADEAIKLGAAIVADLAKYRKSLRAAASNAEGCAGGTPG